MKLKTEEKNLTELRQLEDAKSRQADKLLKKVSARLKKKIENKNMEEIALAETMLVGANVAKLGYFPPNLEIILFLSGIFGRDK